MIRQKEAKALFEREQWELRLKQLKETLNTKRLEEALISLSELASADLKICFFVDGLDEYDGDPEVLINLFTTISKSPHIKACLSSRPLLIFQEAFMGRPGLRLQDLTQNDIRLYVFDKLQTNSKMQLLK